MNPRWQCPRGHFVAHENIRSEDYVDPYAYYGATATWEYTCRGCERVDVGPYMYFEPPRLVDISGGVP